MPSGPPEGYRPDIDGLRAVAVVAVVLYHADLAGLPGGFVGVDVFFVISGYLIGSIVIGALAQGRFSLLHFYDRRARRILPPLIVVVTATAAAGWAVMLPGAYRDFGQSVLATAVFASNVLFFREAGYFDAAAETKALLHTWSLAIEEQFYVVLPLAMMALVRIGRGVWPWAVGAAALASLAVAQAGLADRPDAVFYLLHTRAWELALGVLLAAPALRRQAPGAVRAVLAALGAGLVLWPMLTYGPSTPFPGLAAVPPCLGAALLIQTGLGGTWAARALSWRPAVAVGLISYSLYLWHWPVLVLAGQALARELTLAERIGAVALSVVLAAATWRWVERPARRSRRLSGRGVLAAAAVSLGAMAALGLALHATGGVPGRIDPARLALAEDDALMHGHRHCHFASRLTVPANLCRRGGDGAPRVLLLGDSHADMHGPGLFAAAADAGQAGIQITDSGYVPAPGAFRAGMRARDAANHRLVEAALDAHPSIDTIVVGQFWAQSRRYTLYPKGAGPLTAPVDLTAALDRLIARWPDKRFVLIGPVPTSSRFGAAGAVRARPVAPLSAGAFAAQRRAVAPVLDALARHDNVSVLEVWDEVCSAGGCPAEAPGIGRLYRDEDHLSAAASRAMAPRFRAALSGP
ncbi:acyltransferase [Rhodobacteraceae bacterium CCMM004]|nr:acyltransferase [Rhodobacteraceae bacterium CCMM004]